MHESAAFSPRPHEQRDQLPLGTARVLELVDKHVVVPRLEPIAGARELVHLAQQVDGALEDIGEVEQRARLELASILRHADAEEALHTQHERHVHVAIEASQQFVDDRRQLHRGRAEATRARRAAACTRIGEPLAGSTRACQEVRSQPVQGRADAGRTFFRETLEIGQIAGHHGEGAML